jgi:polar amino acid transport system substrate-binding protein
MQHPVFRALLAVSAALVAQAALAQEPPLRTGVDGTFAPHAFPNLAGGIQGFNVDLANEIAKRLHRRIEIDATQFSGLVPALQAGTYDFIAAPVTVTKERADNLLFTGCAGDHPPRRLEGQGDRGQQRLGL